MTQDSERIRRLEQELVKLARKLSAVESQNRKLKSEIHRLEGKIHEQRRTW